MSQGAGLVLFYRTERTELQSPFPDRSLIVICHDGDRVVVEEHLVDGNRASARKS
jgi:hypothetical protein